MDNEFYYAIGHVWDPKEPERIGFYHYFGEIHRGDLIDAETLLENIQSRNTDRTFYIYRLELTKMGTHG